MSLFSGSLQTSRGTDNQIDGEINKMWPIHTMKYHSALTGKEILQYVTMWMNLVDIMLITKR